MVLPHIERDSASSVLTPASAGTARLDPSSDEVTMASNDGSAVPTTPSDSVSVNRFGVDPHALRTGCDPAGACAR